VIQFHGDSLVPPELCRLLYVTVPDELHVPVIFHNRPNDEVSEGALAVCKGASQIHVEVNRIFSKAVNCAPISVCVWSRLLEVCYHEFGHVATWQESETSAPYWTDEGEEYIEGLADRWMNRRMMMLLDHDPRLAQPRLLRGYVGLRISRLMDTLMSGPDIGGWRNAFVKEVRSRRTGGQLSSGDVLRLLRLAGDAYPELRKASIDIGIDYVDGAGRRHKWYVWGDLPLLESRLKGLVEGDQVRSGLPSWWLN
jgi:hypothetical protein